MPSYFSMKNLTFSFFILLVFSALPFAQAQDASDHQPGELMLMLESDASIDRVLSMMERQTGVPVSPERRLSQYLNLWLVSFDEEQLAAAKYLEVARGSRDVLICQLNHTNIEQRNTPDDPLFPNQWAFENIEAEKAWNIATGGVTAYGDTIVVAVIDGGFDLDHEDLEEQYFVNRQEIPGNNIDDDNNGYVDDRIGWNFYANNGTMPLDNHGTHVAGTIGAASDNAQGVAGVNWNVKVMPLAGSSVQEVVVVSSYAYVYDMRRRYNESAGAEGAYVVATNSSFGVNFGQPSSYPLWCAMYDSLGSVGVLSAGATINSNVNIDNEGDIPTACESDFLVSVTNTTVGDTRNSGAGYGATTIDIGAPGTGVRSTTLNDNYGNLSGTSMATPHVAGAIALMYSAMCQKTFDAYQYDPDGLATYIKDKLLNEGVDQVSALQGQVASGGRLNLYKAVRSVLDSCLNGYTTVTESNCGNCVGEAVVTGVGGFPPYTYIWSTGIINDTVDTGLCAGIYHVTISDSIGQTEVVSFGITDAGGPVLQVATTHNICPGATDGTATVSGGFNHTWSTGATGLSVSNLSAGTYQVSGTDEQGECTTVELFTISEPLPLFADFQMVFPNGGANGSITATTILGGTPPYSLLWNTGDTSSSIDGLDFGNYTLTITDDNGCTADQLAYLDYPEGLQTVESDAVRIYPNPATDRLLIESKAAGSWQLSIFDQAGRMVHDQSLQGSQNTVDVSAFNSGTYFLVFKGTDRVVHEKLMIVGQ